MLGATLVLSLACATGFAVTSAATRRERFAERVAAFPRRFSSEAAGGPARRFRAPKHAESARTRTSYAAVPLFGGIDGRSRISDAASSDLGGAAAAPTAARAGLFLSPARAEAGAEARDETRAREVAPSATASALSRLREVPLLGRFFSVEKGASAGTSTREKRERAREDVTRAPRAEGRRSDEDDVLSPAREPRDGLEDLADLEDFLDDDDVFFPALGDAVDDATRASPASTTAGAGAGAAPGRKYLIGLTTSAGFGDQFKRVSTYAAMARELNRTLVVWPVFTSPHYDLDGRGPNARGPLFFEEYVRVAGDGATDDPNRLVAYRDPSLPRRVRDFPLRAPGACVTSNGQAVDVQFPVSADLSRAVVAAANTASSYEAQVRTLRRLGGGGATDGGAAETLCVASTFGDADYNKARHGETALAWKALDFRPVGRFHHWWANAVDDMVLAAAKANATLGATDAGPARTEPAFRVTSAYTALHWRRGDKCGRKSERQASRNAGPVGHAFDARASGAAQALLCDEASYANAPVLDLCVPLAPMYVATDDQDEAFLAHVKSKGCLLRADVAMSPPGAARGRKTLDELEDVDALVLDVMLVAGAEMSFTYGHTALARLYDRMRMSRGAPRSVNVAADAEAFRRAFAAARAGSGAAGAAAATLGARADELVG